jgi:hypothetical protein
MWGDISRPLSGQAGQRMAHSSTAKGRGLLLPGWNPFFLSSQNNSGLTFYNEGEP